LLLFDGLVERYTKVLGKRSNDAGTTLQIVIDVEGLNSPLIVIQTVTRLESISDNLKLFEKITSCSVDFAFVKLEGRAAITEALAIVFHEFGQ